MTTLYEEFVDPIEVYGATMLAYIGVLECRASAFTNTMRGEFRGLECYATDSDAMLAYLPPLDCRAGDVATNTMRGDLPALGAYANDFFIVPDVSVMVGDLPSMDLVGTLYTEIYDGVIINLNAYEARASQVSNTMVGYLPSLRMVANDTPQVFDTLLILTQTPGYFVMTVGHFVMEVDVHGMLSTEFRMDLALQLFERIVAHDTLTMPGHQSVHLFENPVVRSTLGFIIDMVFNVTANVGDTLDETRHALSVMSDILLATDTVQLPYQARMALAVFAIVGARLGFIDYVEMSDEVIGEVVMSADARRIATLLDTVHADTTFDNRLSAIVSLDSALVVNDDVMATLHANVALMDQAFVGGRFSFAGLNYTIYSMTTVGTGVSEIEGWDYDSFFTIDGKAYATSPRGIVELEGDTDEGTDIDALIRVGLSNFGSALEKRIPNVYIGYTAEGSLALGVVTTLGGSKKINWSELSPIAKASATGARFDVDLGISSVYLDFELRNIEGVDFELNFIKVWQVNLSRRKQV